VSSDWRELPIYDEATDQETTFGEQFASLYEQVKSGETHEAFEEGLKLAMALHGAGLDREALELLTELRSFIAEHDVEPDRWPWLHNVRGMALSSLDRYEEAVAAYLEMQGLADALPPTPVRQALMATALQNRGIVAVEANHPEDAASLLREALPMKLELQDYVSAVDVLNSLALATADLGDLDEAERMLSTVEEVSRGLRDLRRLGAAFANRGIVRARRNQHADAEADFRTALRYARADGDPIRELLAMLNIGSSLADQGRFGDAMRWYRRAASWASEAGTAAVEVRLRRGLALMLLRTGRYREALPEVEQAYETAQELGLRHLAAECLADRAALNAELGEDDLAQEGLEVARQEFALLGDSEWEARVLRNLAQVTFRQANATAAQPLWTAAAELLSQHPEDVSDVARRAAMAWAKEGETAAAEGWLVIELGRASEFEAAAPLAWRTATAGILLNTPRTTDGGVRLLGDALELFEQLGDLRQASQVRIERAVALSDAARYEEALSDLEWCLGVANELSDRALRQHAVANLGEVARRQSHYHRAMACLSEAVELARDLNDEWALAHSLGNLGLARFEQGDFDSAREAYEEQLELARRFREPGSEAVALGGLAGLHFVAGRFGRAASHYRRAAELHAGVSPLGEVEDLGGLLESLAERRWYDELQAVGQRLVDAAQAAGHEDTAAHAFARTARVLLRAGDREAAASLYGTAVRVHLTQANAAEDFMTSAMEAMVHTFGLMAAHIEVDLDEEERSALYEAVLEELDNVESGFGERLRPYLEEVRQGLEEEGIFDRLRKADA